MSPSSKRRRPAPSPSRPARQQPAPAVPDVPPDLDDDDEDDNELAPGSTGGRFNKLGPVAGIAYALVSFLGASMLPLGEVRPEDETAVIARRFVESRGRVSAGVLLVLFSMFFLMVFVAWLHRWLRDVEGRGAWLATLALIGGVLWVAALSVVALLSIAGTVLESFGPDPVIARTLLVLQWQSMALAFVPAAAFIGATSLVGLGGEVLPKWLTYTGLILAGGLLLPPVAFYPYFFSTLWTGMLAVLLLQRARLGWA